ncbi:MAG: putative oxidoreductase [Frankiales bacterium]|jgi:putative oxidoreductase|nr:putative oxidoreductase [Frankiales bacterium]
MNTGLLVLRIVVGSLLIGHGTQKLFGWFGGYGLGGVGDWFDSLGFRPGRAMAAVAGLGEAGGGLLLLLGFLNPLAAAAILGTMLVASSTHLPKIWASEGGLELPFILAAVAVMYGFTGPGRYSLDNALDWHTSGVRWGLGVAAAGVLGALSVVLYARHTLRNTAPAAEAYPVEPELTADSRVDLNR